MKNLRKILIPIDFSPVSQNAVHYVDCIMEKHLTEVVLVFVNTPAQNLEEPAIKRAFKIFEAETLQGVSFYYDFVYLNGGLLPELVHAAALYEADLIIMGTRAHHQAGISLASALVRAVYCPVLVVPESFTFRKIKTIAYANDYRPIQHSEAIRPLWEFALEFNAKVFLLHVNQSHKQSLVLADAAETALEYYMDSLQHEWVNLASDNMEEGINQYLRDHNIDLLVILSRDHGSNQLDSKGRLVGQLTAHAAVPILILC